jgi:hypothetical protein
MLTRSLGFCLALFQVLFSIVSDLVWHAVSDERTRNFVQLAAAAFDACV